TQRNTGMGKGGRVEQNKVDAFQAGFMDALYQLVFCIALQMEQVVASCSAGVAQALVDIIQSLFAINLGFTSTKQVQIGAVQDKNGSHGFGPLVGCASEKAGIFSDFALIFTTGLWLFSDTFPAHSDCMLQNRCSS